VRTAFARPNSTPPANTIGESFRRSPIFTLPALCRVAACRASGCNSELCAPGALSGTRLNEQRSNDDLGAHLTNELLDLRRPVGLSSRPRRERARDRRDPVPQMWTISLSSPTSVCRNAVSRSISCGTRRRRRNASRPRRGCLKRSVGADLVNHVRLLSTGESWLPHSAGGALLSPERRLRSTGFPCSPREWVQSGPRTAYPPWRSAMANPSGTCARLRRHRGAFRGLSGYFPANRGQRSVGTAHQKGLPERMDAGDHRPSG
jgi:hypothetical protein